MTTKKNDRSSIEKTRDNTQNKTIIREVPTGSKAPAPKKQSKLSSLFHKKKTSSSPAPSKTQETPSEKKLFLSPTEVHISKDHDSPHVVSSQNQVKIRPKKKTLEPLPPAEIKAPRSNLLLTIEPDYSEALLMVYKREEGPYTKEELLSFLAENGITHGIHEQGIRDIVENKRYYEDILIARGSSPKEGRDGFYEFHFNPSPETRPIILEDGSVDYNTLGKIELVVEDQLLVTYHKAIPCRPGMDIRGNVIPAPESIDLPPLQCMNCELDDNQFEYYATAEGNVTFEDNVLAVTPLYVVEGDLEAATGDVNFHGDVLIKGNVFANVTIQTTGSITVNGHVEVANLFAGKDVLLKNGMQGSGLGRISAKNNVLAKFLEQTQVFAGNDISANALLNCNVEAGNDIIITGKRGSIIGGTTTASNKISAFSLGNRVGVNTKIVAGLEKEFKDVMLDLDMQTENCIEQLDNARKSLDRVNYQLKLHPDHAELLQQYQEYSHAKIQYESLLDELNTKRGRLMDINERSASCEIVCTGPANPGCNIIINGTSEVLTSEYKDVTFSKHKREIRILSNKLK